MNIGAIIRQTGLKATLQRKTVYEAMIKLQHSSIDNIIAMVQQQNPGITISTIYRILDSFCATGLLSKMNHPNGKCCYDITPSEHHHVFANNEIIDYIDTELTELVKNHLKDNLKHFDVEKISIQIVAKNK